MSRIRPPPDDSFTDLGPVKLNHMEAFWAKHQKWFEDCGYMLRPRYMPGWTPSWLTTDKHGKVVEKDSWLSCEDGRPLKLGNTIGDATRISDGAFVTLKSIKPSVHPYEAEIGTFLSSQALASDLHNHCNPIYEVLEVPDDDDRIILVMPLLRPYNDPPFETFGETVDFFGQIFEGLQFMHKHHVAHRDCMGMNIMMDGSIMRDPWHPCSPSRSRDWKSGFARYTTRTERPPKYYFIDFGISRRYDPKDGPLSEDPIWGGDKTVPEFLISNDACDPFPTDVYYLGNLIRMQFQQMNSGFGFMDALVKDMVQDDPSKRPTMDQVVLRFQYIRRKLSSHKLRSRVAHPDEAGIEAAFNSVTHLFRRIKYTLRRTPAIPSS